jgi:4-hydroxyphenylpyruvate dioxygenase
MQIDRVHFYVDDAKKWRDWFVNVMNFQAIASGNNNHTRTEVVKSDRVKFVLSSPLNASSPVAEYLRLHPPGVADLVFAVEDLETLMANAIAVGTKIKQPIKQQEFARGKIKWCQITSIANLSHTLIERIGITPTLPEPWIIEQSTAPEEKSLFTQIDHLVLNVPLGELETTVDWYEKVFGFERKQTFTIRTARSALHSIVMFHPSKGLQLPVNEPISVNSQIQEFLDLNRGAGIQHIALTTPQIIKATQKLRASGQSFLKVPNSYYQKLRENFESFYFSDREWEKIIQQQILVDLQLDKKFSDRELIARPLLLQIFTQPIFDKPTFFFELIERRDRAKGFGEGNFQALFEAIEREQLKRELGTSN